MDLDDVPPRTGRLSAQVEDIATSVLATVIGHTLNTQLWSLT